MLFVTTFIALIAIAIFFFVPVPISPPSQSTLSSINWSLQSKHIPPRLFIDGHRVLGRWRGGIPHPEIDSKLSFAQHMLQAKEWQWVGVSDARFFLGIAVGQLHYIATAFLFMIDSATQQRAIAKVELPLGLGTNVANGLDDTHSCTTFQSALASSLNISICRQAQVTSIECSAVVNASFTMSAAARIHHHATTDESFSMAFPANDLTRYTHKAGGLSAEGRLRFGDVNYEFARDAMALQDFTRGLFPRHTLWFWVSVAQCDLRTNKSVALQLSTGLYDIPGNNNLETLVWINGKLHELKEPLKWFGRVGEKNLWSFGKSVKVVESANDNGEQLRVVYKPLGTVHASKHLWIVDADLHHTFGIYNGHVVINGERHEIKDAIGVFEDHDALW